MTETPRPTGDNTLLKEVVPDRKISRAERLLGPENYRILKGLLKTPASIIGFILIGIFIFVAVFAPLIAPPVNDDPFKIPRDGFSGQPRPPGTEWKQNVPEVPFWYKPLTGKDEWVHLMGTAQGQYDIFYSVIWGSRTAFRTGLIVVLATVMIGIILGSVSAYYGKWVDQLIMRIVDVFMTVPYIMMALIMAAVLTPVIGRSLVPALLAMITFGWMGYARIIRSDILSVKQRDFILAARVCGVKDGRILFKHILPNAIFPTLVLASLGIGDVVLSFAALSFLGIGTPMGYADWGQVLSFARNWITNLADYWYIVVYPGLTLVFFVMGWNLVGDALRDVLDPKMRGRS
ncbi:MAG TPA: ABC transporter permease [Anaerolineaceae bacterium]|jgi:peptide/nickel transport system permease protein|nr:ABC transporter permease [Chloroflexota bacterium]HNS07782.1 ABC transporter permease [Anaerolineaceae bacterium]HNW13625.1 ABC transporter permease [Anaerolineaceae bacterium]HOE01531.1 ABC transporter permease [Anaerolineaceae bacterium]HOQ68682.1 ABC transporter permease [Anaerolineaceae bacterium]